MDSSVPGLVRTKSSHARPPFECVALTLQGGGALGAYQAGVYEALDRAGIHPDWVAGISIGAINAAIIAGNPPESRVPRLREFWTKVTYNPIWDMLAASAGRFAEDIDTRRALNQASAQTAALAGAPGLFTPRALPPTPRRDNFPSHAADPLLVLSAILALIRSNSPDSPLAALELLLATAVWMRSPSRRPAA